MKVLVAVDNRPSSQATIDALVKMHWADGTEIVLLTVSPPGSEDVVAEGHSISAFEEMENLAVELRSVLRNCEVSFFAQSGDPKALILKLAEQIGAELIVLGSNCKSTLERLVLGSVCQSVLNGAKCPVIVAKRPCCLAREASPAFKTIVVTIDNSVYSNVAMAWLAKFHWGQDSKFLIVAVVDEDTDLESVKLSLNKHATNLSKLLGTDNVSLEISIGEPQHMIVEMATAHYADLIVMGSHGHTGLKEMFLGRVSHAVSHTAPCAIAITRGYEVEDKELSAGVFPKLKREPAFNAVQSFRNEDGRGEDSPHVMPGGF